MIASRVLAAAVTGILLLAGCSDSPSPNGDEAAEPTSGGTLVVAIDSDPGTLNPAITTSGATHTASELMFNGLVSYTPGQEPQPELAESWDVEEDGALYRFHLRRGVTWHDGEPFTSGDVKFTFEELLFELHSRTKASVGAAIESITTPDEDTVEFRFREPYAPLLRQLDVTEAPILPEHVYGGVDPLENPANNEPVGTGPFKLQRYTPSAEVRLVANRDYFREGMPKLDKVVMRIIPEPANQVIALESGEVDWLFGVPGPDLERLQDSGKYDFLQTAVNPGGANCIMTVSFNLERPMFQDVRVRRALSTALDAQQFLDRVLFGQGKVATAPISSGIPVGHADNLDGMPVFDRAAAETLLDEAGWVRDGGGVRKAEGVEGVKDGTRLAFDFLHFPGFASYGQLLKAQLDAVGADVKLVPLEPPVFVETVFTSRKFDTNIISYCNGADPEIGVKRMYVSSNIGPIPFSNSSAYDNREVDRLFDEARATVDDDERMALYRTLQEQLVEDLPYFWLVETESTRVFTTKCQGFSGSGHFAETASCST